MERQAWPTDAASGGWWRKWGECLLYISSDSGFPRYCHGCCSDLGIG